MVAEAAPMQISLYQVESNGQKGSLIVTLGRNDQVDDAERFVTQSFLELFTQQSALPARRKAMGQTAGVQFSVSDVYNFEILAYATNQAVRTDSTTPTKKLILGLGVSGGEPLKAWCEAIPYDGNAPSTDPNRKFVIPNGQFITDEVRIVQGLQTQNKYNVTITSEAALPGLVIDGVAGGFHWFQGDDTVSTS